MSIILSAEQKDELKSLHKQECYRRHADRIKAILFLDLGLTYDDIARYLLLDDQTIRNYEKRYSLNLYIFCLDFGGNLKMTWIESVVLIQIIYY